MNDKITIACPICHMMMTVQYEIVRVAEIKSVPVGSLSEYSGFCSKCKETGEGTMVRMQVCQMFSDKNPKES